MDKICKPHIVDLLRISDQKRWLWPRIRYASIRSKPTLLQDLRAHFREELRGRVLHLVPRVSHLVQIPEIAYDFGRKKFLFDGKPIDVPRMSRAKVRFSVTPGPVTLTF